MIEIDLRKLDTNLLYPDEDFLSQIDKARTLKEHRKKLDDCKMFWDSSLFTLGNCAYKGVIKPEWITRYCIVDFDIASEISEEVSNGSFEVKIEHYQELKPLITGFTEWFFGDRELLPQITYYQDHVEYLKTTDREIWEIKDYSVLVEHYKWLSANRTGIEVVNL